MSDPFPTFKDPSIEGLREILQWTLLPTQQRQAFSKEFLQSVRGREFPNPRRGQPHAKDTVQFQSLPPQEQKRLYEQWKRTIAPRQHPQEMTPEEQAMIERAEAREDASGMGHDDTRQHYGLSEMWGFMEADAKEARMEDYAFALPFSPVGPTPGIKMPGNPGHGEQPPEPPPPAEVRRMLADKMRNVGRQLIVSGMKPPRPQMLAVGKALEELLDQLDALADQPGRKALKRRILLQLRPRILNAK